VLLQVVLSGRLLATGIDRSFRKDTVMSVLIALTVAIVLIIVSMIRTKKPQTSGAPLMIPRYFHPGHSWARQTEDGDFLVGVDELAQGVIGGVDELRLPRLLKRVRQGEVAWQIRHGRRTVNIVSPITGWVVQQNEMALRNPGLVNSCPLGDGWLVRIHPSKTGRLLPNLLTGKNAARWQDLARAQLAGMFSATPALMYQDGGVLLNDLADRCSDEEWGRIERELFLSTPKTNT
jgi:glycine cleavage system H lipoate-binding protein